jgi:hypothetical protein
MTQLYNIELSLSRQFYPFTMTEFRHLQEYSRLRNRSQKANYLACLGIHGQIIQKCTKKNEMKLTHNAARVTTTTEWNRDQLQTRKE